MSELLILVLTIAFTFIFVGIMIAILPYITRKNTQFGVMLPEQANEHLDIQKYKKQFAVSNFGLSFIGALSMFIGFMPNLTEEQALNIVVWGGTSILTVYTIMSFVIYYYYHQKVKVLKQQYFSASDTAADARIMVATHFRNHEKPVIVSNGWLVVIGFILILMTTIAPIIYYEQIPDQVPTHFGFDGVPTSFTNKAPSVFAVMPIIQLVTLPLLILANYSYKGAKQNIRPKNPKVSLEQNRAFRYAWSKYLVGVGIGTLIVLAFVQFSMITAFQNMLAFSMVVLVATGLLLIGTLYLMVKYGQGGERYQPKNIEQKEYPHQVVDGDEYWKIGMFYYNPNDPAIFVEKRFGVGTTFNYARWQTWALVIGTIVITIIIIGVSLWML